MDPTQLKQPLNHPIDETIQDCISQLNKLKNKSIVFKRPVFFIPGRNDENCRCWTEARGGSLSLKDWLNNVAADLQDVYFINFQAESKHCDGFLEFGELIKKKIWAVAGKEQACDVVCHHMGGLGLRAAVVLGQPLNNIHSCVTVAAPHRGEFLKGWRSWFINDPQSRSLRPESEPIKSINTFMNRQLFLDRIQAFYQIAALRPDGVINPDLMPKDGAEKLYREKTYKILLKDADWPNLSRLTHDPRIILKVFQILLQ